MRVPPDQGTACASTHGRNCSATQTGTVGARKEGGGAPVAGLRCLGPPSWHMVDLQWPRIFWVPLHGGACQEFLQGHERALEKTTLFVDNDTGGGKEYR